MANMRIQRIQDSIHGLMEFCGVESLAVELLRTPELQRLKKVRQLGLVHLVFPGAEHSRFLHSLGAAYLAVRFGRQIRARASAHFIPALCPDEGVVRDLAIAALCHDLGHGPLSHAWEREIVTGEFDRKKWVSSLGIDIAEEKIKTLKWHELVSHGLLLWEDGHLHKLLEQHERGSSKTISQLLQGEYFLGYFPRILIGDVDVDRADFIRRDTHHTGVAYGRYDLEWLISTCCFGELNLNDAKETVVGFDERKAVRVVEQFLIARRAMYETVYHHKTVRCAEGMMALFLRRLRHVIREGMEIQVPEFVKPMIEIIHGNAVPQHQILQLDDFSLSVLIEIVAVSGVKDITVTDLAQRLRARDLFKQVLVSSKGLNRYFREDNAKQELYAAMEPYCPGESHFYLVEDAIEFSVLSKKDSEKACLVRSNGEARYIHDHPDFDQYRGGERDELRIFTVREAVTSVENVINQTLKRVSFVEEP